MNQALRDDARQACRGQTVTLVVYLASGYIACAQYDIPASGTFDTQGVNLENSWAANVFASGNEICVRVYNVTNSDVLKIKRVLLLTGGYTLDTLPPYTPRPYSVELAECQRYFERIGDAHSELLSTTMLVDGQRYAMFMIHYAPKRKTPTILLSAASNYRVLTKGLQENMASANSIESLSAYSVMNTDATIIVKMNGGVYANNAILQRSDSATAAWIDVVADL
ncbi:hypothetical protein [Beduinella massiliensis]|uniref:hypothetical protein n=1 Tax=Beduinella massiliensis TaxID=1852363 RepID=UPI0011AFB7CD